MWKKEKSKKQKDEQSDDQTSWKYTDKLIGEKVNDKNDYPVCLFIHHSLQTHFLLLL